jgi:hypothetical protein
VFDASWYILQIRSLLGKYNVAAAYAKMEELYVGYFVCNAAYFTYCIIVQNDWRINQVFLLHSLQ